MKWTGWTMKHLCFSKIISLLLFLSLSLYASLDDKSALFYYGKKISYPMVGIHDYIVVEPKNTNEYTHGFSIYKEKMYAHINLCQKDSSLEEEIHSISDKGFKNIYFDSDASTCEREKLKRKILYFHSKYPQFKIMINAKLVLSEEILGISYAVVIESTTDIKQKKIKKIREYGLDIIYLKYMATNNLEDMQEEIAEIKGNHMIPYISNNMLDIYGVSSKVGIKREILTLIDESKIDRMLLSAHQHGAVVFEYLGYIQKLHNIQNGLPDINKMQHYAGVVIWLSQNYEHPSKLVKWVLELQKRGIKVAFINNFGANISGLQLNQLGIEVFDGDNSDKKRVIQKDSMMAYEIEPSLSDESLFLKPKNAKPLLTYVDKNGLSSIPAAITSWGGYAMREAFMFELNDENIWIINPFKFFAEALRLKKLLVPDTTTENGNRLLFTHIDGDGIMNYVESNPELFSGDIILNEILKKYAIPHSVSVIGAEIAPNGLYPKLSKQLLKLAKSMYALNNVEPATHTFTHPFIWNKIVDGKLDEKYRLKPNGYNFSLYNELDGSLDYINRKLTPKRKATTVFWSGDCAPTEEILKYVYKHNVLNINGGYTVISNASPWLTNVAPLGLERGEYYQVYTGAQNENVYTNDWLGPFWGFKKVVQTFKLTNSPRRLKPIDIYYHLYSGSKIASLNALRYIFDWAIKEDVLPIFTSEYIPKVMDYFTLSMANEGDEWLFDGMVHLKTLRNEESKKEVDLRHSKSVLGTKTFEVHKYISLDNKSRHKVKLVNASQSDISYLVSSNAQLAEYKKGIQNKSYLFDGYVNLKVGLHLSKDCTLETKPKFSKKVVLGGITTLFFNHKKVTINVLCR